MTTQTLAPLERIIAAAQAPKDVAGYLSFEGGQRLRIDQPPAWIDSTVRDADGFETCWADDCGEAIGSPHCCDQRPSVVAEYNARREQLTAEQIVRRSPVNAGLVTS